MSKVTLTRFLAVIVQMEIGWTMEHSQCKIRKIMTKKKKKKTTCIYRKFPNGQNYVIQLKYLVLIYNLEEIFHYVLSQL